ncbi:MAG: NAD-dependent epimerase/dehydratase family protein [Myxococcales bacterium]|nr:NAD-dependent epimerase/dehydratase family protein [Myxococcales bacterium]
MTGASGFVGGAVARALVARGDTVRCVQRSDVAALRCLGAEVARVDLGADGAAVRAALAGASAVVHIAAKATVWGPRAAFVAANVTATAHVLAACRAEGISRLVYTSTPSVVHSGGDVEGVDESAPVIRDSPSAYAATKAHAERLVLAANDATLATVALRPHLIWGPDDTQLTARIVARARAGRLRLVGGGTKLIDSVYIDNAVAAHLLALDQVAVGAACAGKAYFITQGQPMPQKQLIDGILAAAGLPPCTQSIPPGLAWTAGALLELVWWLLRRRDEPLLTRFVATQLATAHWYDISAARRDLGYVPTVSVAEGLERLRVHLAPTR